MKRFKNYIVLGMAALLGTSCSDFLDVTPKDALSPSTTWQTETDAEKFAIGCYDGWEDGGSLLYFDCGSDFGYNNFSWEGYRPWGDGTLSASNTGASLYSFTTIRRCNTFLENVEAIPFSDEAVKNDLIAQVRFIRAYKYFNMNWWYGGVPIIDNYETAEEAQVPRNTEDEVRTFVEQELDAITPMLNDAPAERGRAAKGAALALRMREALYYEDWATAKDRAQQIIDLGLYSLDPSYTNLFSNSGKDSPEIIMAVQYMVSLKGLGTIGQMYNNANGGWSSIVPTHNLIDTYEMENGMTKKVTEPYLVDALSFTEAEARIIEEMTPFLSGEFTVSDIKRANYSELFNCEEETADRWFKCKLLFITLDEKSGAEKKTSTQILVQASDLRDAVKRLDEGMKGTMADYVIASVAETPIMDVYPYKAEPDVQPECPDAAKTN